jgi:hypothetical protein
MPGRPALTVLPWVVSGLGLGRAQAAGQQQLLGRPSWPLLALGAGRPVLRLLRLPGWRPAAAAGGGGQAWQQQGPSLRQRQRPVLAAQIRQVLPVGCRAGSGPAPVTAAAAAVALLSQGSSTAVAAACRCRRSGKAAAAAMRACLCSAPTALAAAAWLRWPSRLSAPRQQPAQACSGPTVAAARGVRAVLLHSQRSASRCSKQAARQRRGLGAQPAGAVLLGGRQRSCQTSSSCLQQLNRSRQCSGSQRGRQQPSRRAGRLRVCQRLRVLDCV